MTSKAGFYSVVQFVPSSARREGLNVGVVVAVEGEELRCRFTESDERIARVFGAQALDQRRLQSMKRALERRLRAIEPSFLR